MESLKSLSYGHGKFQFLSNPAWHSLPCPAPQVDAPPVGHRAPRGGKLRGEGEERPGVRRTPGTGGQHSQEHGEYLSYREHDTDIIWNDMIGNIWREIGGIMIESITCLE